MRSKTRLVLAIGCVSLFVLTIPALSLPSPVEKQIQIKKAAPPNAKALRNKGAHNKVPAKAAAAPRLTSMRISEPPKKPRFGWPALVSEARKYLGTNPTARKRLWCATFLNLVLAKTGYAGTNSDAAKSFAYYGRRVSEPKVGAIAVLTRGKRGGHVGVVTGIDTHGNPIIISGNHGHRVAEAIYPRARVIAYVMPTDKRPVNTQVAERVNTQVTERKAPARAAKPTEPAFEGPITELLAAIQAEPVRTEQSARSARLTQPAQPPQRIIHQASSRNLPIEPGLAELLGLKERAQAAPPRPAPQRQQLAPGRVAVR